jgi:hypothetical protein
MSIIKTIAKLGFGLVAGGAIGAVVSSKTAPEDPTSKRYQVRQYFRDANRAGQEAQAVRQAELISRFRQDVNDYDALDNKVDHSVGSAEATIARSIGAHPPAISES